MNNIAPTDATKLDLWQKLQNRELLVKEQAIKMNYHLFYCGNS